MVAEVPPGLRCFHPAPAVDDLFLFYLRVVDAGKGADVAAQHIGQFSRARLALAAVGVGQEVQRAFDVERFAVDFEFQPGDCLVEHPLPSIADHAEVVQKFLHFIRHLIGLHGADTVEDGFVACQIRVFVQELGKVIVGQFVQFQREKDQRRGVIGDFLLAVGHELGPA